MENIKSTNAYQNITSFINISQRSFLLPSHLSSYSFNEKFHQSFIGNSYRQFKNHSTSNSCPKLKSTFTTTQEIFQNNVHGFQNKFFKHIDSKKQQNTLIFAPKKYPSKFIKNLTQIEKEYFSPYLFTQKYMKLKALCLVKTKSKIKQQYVTNQIPRGRFQEIFMKQWQLMMLDQIQKCKLDKRSYYDFYIPGQYAYKIVKFDMGIYAMRIPAKRIKRAMFKNLHGNQKQQRYLQLQDIVEYNPHIKRRSSTFHLPNQNRYSGHQQKFIKRQIIQNPERQKKQKQPNLQKNQIKSEKKESNKMQLTSKRKRKTFYVGKGRQITQC